MDKNRMSFGTNVTIPRPALVSGTPTTGVSGIFSGLADTEVQRQQTLNRTAGLGGLSVPRIVPAQPQPQQPSGSGVYYNPSMDRFAVGGLEFGREDYDVALKSPQYASRQAAPPSGNGWQRITDAQYQGYLSTISEGRGIIGNIGIGLQNVGEGLVSGAGRGLQMLGAEGAGAALVGAGELIGTSAAQDARSGAISERQGFGGKVGTAVVQSAPSLALSVGAGIAGAKAGGALGAVFGPGGAVVGGALGAAAGVALSIFPMELQSSWEAAEQNDLNTSDNDVQTDILMSSLFKTAAQTVAPAIIAKGFSPALRAVVGEATKRTFGGAVRRGIGTGALEGSAEALAQITDRVVFEPELRAELNEADYAALMPLVFDRHGEEVAISFAAGFLMGGAAGAVSAPTPPTTPKPTPTPRASINDGQAVNALSGATVEPQRAGLTAPRPEVLEAEALERGYRNLPDQFGGALFRPELNAEEAMLEAALRAQVDPIGPIAPSNAAPAPLALPSPTAAGGAIIPPAPARAAARAPAVPVTPIARPAAPPVAPVAVIPQQRAADMGLVGPVAEGFATGAARQGPPAPVPTSAAPTNTVTETALAAQFNKLRAQAAQRQAATPTVEATPAVAAAPEVDTPDTAVTPTVSPREYDAAYAQWELLRSQQPTPESLPTLARLNKKAQREWVDAERAGTADLALFNKLFKRKVSKAEPLVDTGVTRTQPGPAQEDVDAMRRQVEATRAAEAQRQQAQVGAATLRNLSQRLERVRPVERPDDIPPPKGGPGKKPVRKKPAPASAPKPTVTQAPKGAALKRGVRNAVQEPSSAGVDARQQPTDGQEIRAGDAEGQATAGARTQAKTEAKPAEARAVVQAVKQPVSARERFTTERAGQESGGTSDKAPPRRTEEQIAADTAREADAVASQARSAALTVVAPTTSVVSTSPAAEAWAAEVAKLDPDMQKLTPAYDALPVAQQDAWAASVRKGRAADPRKLLQKLVNDAESTARPEADAEVDIAVLSDEVLDMELDMVSREFSSDKRDAAVRLVQIRDSADTPANLKLEATTILEGNLTAAQLADVELLAAGGTTDLNIITQTITDINTGALPAVTANLRGILLSAYGRIKASNPEYNGRPLADYIDTSKPEFFNLGSRINGIRPVVAKGTGRTSRTTFNFVGGTYNNLDGTPVTRSLPHGRAKMIVGGFLRALQRAPRVLVFTNVAQLKAKNPALYERAAAARDQGDFDTVTAAGYSFGDGEVIIFTDNIANEAHLRFVLAHETMGHFGLRGFIPAKQFDATMDSVYETSPHIQGAVDAAMHVNPDMSKSEAVEEYLSDFAALIDTSMVRRVWNAVKGALNALGIKFADDYPRYLINQARRYARSPDRGRFADMDAIAQRAQGVEDGSIAPGRYKRLDEVFTSTAHAMNMVRLGPVDNLPPKLMAQFKAQDIAQNYKAFKSEFLSLFEFTARKNPALKELNNIISSGIDLTTSMKNLLNEVMGPALNLAVTIPGTNISFGGRTEQEVATVNSALAVARIRAASAIKANPKSIRSKTPIYKFNEQTGQWDDTGEAERLDSLHRITLKEFQEGFTAELKRDTGEVQKFTFAGDPTATEESGAWLAYTAARDAMLMTEKKMLLAKLQAQNTTISAAMEDIASVTPDNRLTLTERALIRRAAALYTELYNKGVRVDPETGQTVRDTEAVRLADQFLATFNMALIADKSAIEDANLSDTNSAASRNSSLRSALEGMVASQEADDTIAGIESFKARVRTAAGSGFRKDKFLVQEKIKALNSDAYVVNNGEEHLRNSVGSQYTPIIQQGTFEGRMAPIDVATGKPVALAPAYAGSMGYTQFDSLSEALEFKAKLERVMVDTDEKPLTYKVEALDGSSGSHKETTIRIEFVVDQVLEEIVAPLRGNLNEFMLMLDRYNMQPTPQKMEELIVDLTKQDDRARKRLLTEFTSGDPQQGLTAIARHIEGRASTISKIIMQPMIDQLLSRRNQRSKELWEGDPKRVAATKARFEQLRDDPTARTEAVDLARRDYEEAQMMFDETGGRPNEARNQAGKTLAFLTGNEDVMESALESKKWIAQWRNLTSVMYLGLSFATAALNPVSVYTNTVPFLASRNSKTAFGGGFGIGPVIIEINRAFKQVGVVGLLPNAESAKFNTAQFWDDVAQQPALQTKHRVTEFEARMLAREIRDGSMQPALTNAVSQTARGMATTGIGQKIIDVSMYMFNVTEQASRRAAGLAAFRMEFKRRVGAIDPDIKDGTPEFDRAVEAAYQASVDFVSQTMKQTLGEYATVNRPNFFRSGLPGLLYMYKVFPTTSIQLYRNLDMKGKALMLSGLFAMGGVAAFPFAEDLEDLYDTLSQMLGFGEGSVRAQIARTLDDIAPGLSYLTLKGVAGQMLPIDVMSRVSLGNVLPGTDALLAGGDMGRAAEEILGPMPSALFGTIQSLVDLARVPLSDRVSLEDVAREAPITALRMVGDTYAYYQSGAVVDRRGYVVTPDVTWYEMAGRMAGFYPTAAANEYGAIRVINRVANYRREVAAQYRSKWVQARMRNDRVLMREIEADVRDWNEQHRGTPLSISNFVSGSQKAYREAIKPATARTLRATPTEGRDQFERLTDILTE